jgi:predicted RNA-binding protein with PUA-like domain
MAHWILKTEPSEYSFADLRRDRRTRWSGITNAQALIHLRQMATGDEVLIYHTGDVKALVGRGTVVRPAYPDPEQADAKRVVVDIAAGEALPAPVSLAAIKADGTFAELGLVRNGRLSVVPVPPAMWGRLEAMARRT